MPRARDLGIVIGQYPTGSLNAITDVEGVAVGHVTLIEGERTRTGATAILPHGGNLFLDKVPAGLSVLNGYGKFAGGSQIAELGEIETPILLTNTLAVGRGVQALVDHTLAENPLVTSVNAVVGETNDGRLNDIRAARPTVAEMRAAIQAARPGTVAEGAVGAGTGSVAFGRKGGVGTASRQVGDWMLGVLVQANYGGHLRLDGRAPAQGPHDVDGSVVVVLASDAPLCARNLGRLATRAFGGIARTGAALSNGSGDYALAFSTHPDLRLTPKRRAAGTQRPVLPNELCSPLFQAAIEATEEAVLNALLAAGEMQGWDASTRRTISIPGLVP